jgi:hypothetical protein
MDMLGVSYQLSTYHSYYRDSQDSAAGIVTLHRLDGPGIQPQQMQDFSIHSRTSSKAHPAIYAIGTGSLFKG